VNFANTSRTLNYRQCYYAGSRMAEHSECTVGHGLGKYNTGCTIAVCMDPQYAGCCADGVVNAWSASCVAAANAKCTGGRERWSITGSIGFCNTQIPFDTVFN
jgi:hypothetical protein